MKRKLLAMLLSVAVGSSLVGCGGENAGQEMQNDNEAASAEESAGAVAKTEDTGETESAENTEETEVAEESVDASAGSSESAGLPAGSKIGFSTMTLASEFFRFWMRTRINILRQTGMKLLRFPVK